MKKYIIDRIEGKYAVLECEDGAMENVEASLIKGCREGDSVIFEDGVYTVSKELTSERKRIIEEKMKKLFKEQ